MSPQPESPQWFCAQIGAREHYAVPRVLHQSGRLATLYTDFWAGPATRAAAARWNSGALRSLATRWHQELSDGGRKSGVHSWNLRALWWEMILRRQKTGNPGRSAAGAGPYHAFIELGRRFATCVREDLKRQKNLPPGAIFYAYDTGALEAFAWCRERGLKCVLNQMDPNRVEVDLVRAEEKQWPGWAPQSIQVPDEYFVRREQEWALADRIVVNSEFSRQALLQQGVPPEKLVVIPLCFDPPDMNRQPATGDRQPDHPLRVLFLGQVILRKGIQYLLAAAKQLEKENIHFDIVGPVGISADAVATAPKNVTFHGRTGRDQAANWYRQSQVFVLPTLSDGFAITQLEAMAHALPVVTTPCCGEVVSDGVDGFIIPPRAVEPLVRAFQSYLVEPDLLRRQSAAALLKTRQFTAGRLAENLRRLEADLLPTENK